VERGLLPLPDSHFDAMDKLKGELS
jgi:hypothetical protein